MANLLERVEDLHRRVTELEQRVPKPIPVVEPLVTRIPRWLDELEDLARELEADGQSNRAERLFFACARARVAKAVP